MPPPAAVQPINDALTYEPFFGLNEKPFSLDSDPRFIYNSPAHETTRRGLLSSIRRREGLIVLTGEIGTGKTTLCRTVLRDLGRNTYSSIVPDPFAAREDLLKMLLIDFGVLSIEDLTEGRLRQASRTELGYLLSDFLNKLSRDAFAVVIIDEAQNLSLPLIEETRILFDTFGAKGRLQILFVGQPELHAKLKLPEMRQVDQRVCGYHRLTPMNADAVAGYVAHRLQVAGARSDAALFPPAIVDALAKRTGGVPRLINRVCDRALQLAYEQQVQAINQAIFDTALLEVGAVTLSPTWDSIIFAEGAAKAPMAAPVPTSAKAATAGPVAVPAKRPVLSREPQDFQKDVDDWVETELPSTSRPESPLFAGLDLPPQPRPVPAAPAKRTPSSKTAPQRGIKNDWPRNVRSETYVQRFMRIWLRRGAIALAAFVAANLVLAGLTSFLSLLEPAALPMLPIPPAQIVGVLELPAAPGEAAASGIVLGESIPQ